MEDIRVIQHRELKEGDVVWVCAYATNNTEKSMALKQKPVQGVIMNVGKKRSWSSYEILSFVPYNAKGVPIKSKAVSVGARTYTKTEKEATIIYNNKVQKQIDFLNSLIDDCKQDFI